MSVELLRDAEGREIPLDTTVLYDKDGNEIEVSRYQYYPKVGPGYWNLRSVRNKYYRTDEVYLIPPDSWSKLEEDLGRASGYDIIAPSCRYFTAGKCVDCRMRNGATCGIRKNERAFADILERIHKLRGEDE